MEMFFAVHVSVLLKTMLATCSIGDVTARKNQPSSYRFTEANQRTSCTILDYTSQISLKVAFSLENYQDVIKSQFLIKY